MRRFTNRLLIAATLSTACGLPMAATKTTTFAVTATVATNCFINSASTLAFGTYAPGGGDVDQTSTILVRCTNTTPYGIGLNAGTGLGSTLLQRTLTSLTAVGSTVHYNLFTTAARTQIWDNPATAAAVVNNQGGVGTGLGNVLTHTVHGRLQDSATSQAAAAAADYTSTITVTINY